MGRVGLRFSRSFILSISDVIMSDEDCTPSREPRSVAASLLFIVFIYPAALAAAILNKRIVITLFGLLVELRPKRPIRLTGTILNCVTVGKRPYKINHNRVFFACGRHSHSAG